MPELPDISIYLEALERYVGGQVLERVRVASPFVVRSFKPPLSAVHGRAIRGFGRLGKRLVVHFDEDLHLVIHLMIAGRLRWKKRGQAVPRKGGLAAFDFPNGSILFTEASTHKRASIHLVQGAEALAAHDRGGIDVLACTPAEFIAAMRRENHTLKRSLTDQRILSGIGNAYSDEILHAAQLSPMKQVRHLTDEELERIHAACRLKLAEWTDRLRTELGEGFPDKVTAFHDQMAVHGKYGEPCPVCGAKVQRIRYASNECNYCARCQVGGRLLADRSLSRLLKNDWPKTLEDME